MRYQTSASSDSTLTANCIIIAQFPIENHSEQGQYAELPVKTIGKSGNLGDYCAICSELAATVAACSCSVSSLICAAESPPPTPAPSPRAASASASCSRCDNLSASSSACSAGGSGVPIGGSASLFTTTPKPHAHTHTHTHTHTHITQSVSQSRFIRCINLITPLDENALIKSNLILLNCLPLDSSLREVAEDNPRIPRDMVTAPAVSLMLLGSEYYSKDVLESRRVQLAFLQPAARACDRHRAIPITTSLADEPLVVPLHITQRQRLQA